MQVLWKHRTYCNCSSHEALQVNQGRYCCTVRNANKFYIAVDGVVLDYDAIFLSYPVVFVTRYYSFIRSFVSSFIHTRKYEFIKLKTIIYTSLKMAKGINSNIRKEIATIPVCTSTKIQ